MDWEGVGLTVVLYHPVGRNPMQFGVVRPRWVRLTRPVPVAQLAATGDMKVGMSKPVSIGSKLDRIERIALANP